MRGTQHNNRTPAQVKAWNKGYVAGQRLTEESGYDDGRTDDEAEAWSAGYVVGRDEDL